jgi:hypothetical protein
MALNDHELTPGVAVSRLLASPCELRIGNLLVYQARTQMCAIGRRHLFEGVDHFRRFPASHGDNGWMGCAESLTRLKIATIEKMKARVQMKIEPRFAPPTAMLMLKEKCASIVLTTWPPVRLKSNAKKMPNAATISRKATGGRCCCGKPGKKKAGRCHSAQVIAITSAAARGLSLRSR